MLQWRDKSKATTSSDGGDSEVSLPLGPGEWDSALGLPLCVVCQNVSYSAQNAAYNFTDWFPGRSNGSTGTGAWLEGR